MGTTQASDRFHGALAPNGMRLTQELLNTIAHTSKPPHQPDLLLDRATAEAWLTGLGSAWCSDNGRPTPDLTVSAAGLSRIRQLRTSLRRALGVTDGKPRDPDERSVSITFEQDTLSIYPSGNGAAWLESAIALERVAATATGDIRRLKLCQNHVCTVAFYDRSKNNSKVWDDLARCGNPANVRAYRERQRLAPVIDSALAAESNDDLHASQLKVM